MKTKEILNNLIRYLRRIEHPIFNSILNIVMLLVAIMALIIAIKALNNADAQFKQNSKSSDSLFNLQLKSSQKLNDSLVYQIGKLQEITNNQLKITSEQLNISLATLNDQVYSGRPKFLITNELISDTNMIYNNIYSPIITVSMKNIGRRFAYKFNYRPILVYSDYSDLRHAIRQSDTITIEPEGDISQDFKPKLNLNTRNNFYFCYELSYYDRDINKYFKQAYYKHYCKNRNDFQFLYCKNTEVVQLKKTINRYLRKYNQTPFDE